jgi:phenylacetate-CoA ligase
MRDFDVEKISLDQADAIRSERLAETVEYAYSHSVFYREYYDKAGVSPDMVKSTGDLQKLPFINRNHLSENSGNMVCVPLKNCIDICPTSGTTGKSIYFPMTKNDLILFADLCERGARTLGIDENDTVQMMLTLDRLLQPSQVMTRMFQFNLECLTLRTGPAGTDYQIKIMRELKPSVLFGISTYLLSLGRSLGEYGFDPKRELNLKLLLSTGSGIYHSRWSPSAVHREVSEIWGVPYYSILGSTELNTGFWECPARNGHHVHWDYYITEIIDPETGENAGDGEPGELVLTAMGREALPLIRYRTGDITTMETAPCPCGKTTPRIMAITGRRDEMLKIKGTLIFPLQVEEAVLSVPGVEAHLIEVTEDERGQAQLVITAAFADETGNIEEQIKQAVKSETNITAKVKRDNREKIEEIWYCEKRVKPRKFWDRRV